MLLAGWRLRIVYLLSFRELIKPPHARHALYEMKMRRSVPRRSCMPTRAMSSPHDDYGCDGDGTVVAFCRDVRWRGSQRALRSRDFSRRIFSLARGLPSRGAPFAFSYRLVAAAACYGPGAAYSGYFGAPMDYFRDLLIQPEICAQRSQARCLWRLVE